MRTRVRNKQLTGAIREDGVFRLGSSLATLTEVTKDFPTRPYQPGLPFDSLETNRYGTLTGFTRGYEVSQFAPLYLESIQLPVMEYSRDYLEYALTRHMAQANPSSSGTNFSETIAELPKLPEMFKFTGTGFLKTYGSAFLNTTFGWAPLLGDLASLLFVAADTDAMFDRIQRLKRKEDFSSKRSLETRRHTINQGRKVLNSALLWVEGDSILEQGLKGHTFVRYSPDPTGMPPASSQADRVLAYAAAKGLVTGAYEAWQLVPWAWLSDWCFNTSDYLKANRNVIGATCTEAYAAVTALTFNRFGNLDVPRGLHWDATPEIRRESKLRIPLSPAILPTMPVLNAGRVGILSALIAKWV